MSKVLSAQDILQAQQENEEMDEMTKNATINLQLLSVQPGIQIYCNISNGVLRPYIPKVLMQKVFDSVHALSHPSDRSTCRVLREKYIWPAMKKDALKGVRTCLACQKSKIQCYNKLQLCNIEVPDNRFNHVHLDLIELSVDNDYRYCLTMMDRFSR
ncbi:hypothetical protein KM043_016464 [Ampulex compressa]|nr:hypothetical protein KM043_016464 [Ampulex compressa]